LITEVLAKKIVGFVVGCIGLVSKNNSKKLIVNMREKIRLVGEKDFIQKKRIQKNE